MVTGDRPVRRGPVAPFVLALATGASATEGVARRRRRAPRSANRG